MLHNFVPAERKTEVSYDLTFWYDEDRETGGFCFPCDRVGKVLPFQYEEAKQNYENCMAHPEQFKVFAEVQKFVNHYTEPAHGTCSCGEEVELYDQYYGACQCPKCGQWYNLFGQSLVPPECWEHDPAEEEYW